MILQKGGEKKTKERKICWGLMCHINILFWAMRWCHCDDTSSLAVNSQPQIRVYQKVMWNAKGMGYTIVIHSSWMRDPQGLEMELWWLTLHIMNTEWVWPVCHACIMAKVLCMDNTFVFLVVELCVPLSAVALLVSIWESDARCLWQRLIQRDNLP